MKTIIAHLTWMLAIAIPAPAQQLYFPPTSGDAWDTVSPASLGWCQDELDSFIQFLGERETKAFIILKDGKMAVEHYYGTFTQDSNWYWASAGKSLTAFLVGLAQQEGHLSIHDTTAQYLGTGWTSAPPGKEEMITIRHQLTMATGLDDGVADPYCTLSSCLEYKADAGTRWAYHNAPYTLLDEVIKVSTGQNLNTWLATQLSSKTGINGLFIKAGYNNVFFSKARSMARFGLLVQIEASGPTHPS